MHHHDNPAGSDVTITVPAEHIQAFRFMIAERIREDEELYVGHSVPTPPP
jgi:hypothetical protein